MYSEAPWNEEQAHWSYVRPDLEVRPCKIGKGLFATAPIAKGQVLVAWTGKVIHRHDVANLPEAERESYILQIHEDLYQIPVEIGKREKADFVNHSCDPNGGMDGDAILVAMRDIKEGEEITFDYSMCECDENNEDFICQCGSPSCRKLIRWDDWKKKDLWDKYSVDRFATHIKKRILALQKCDKTQST